MNDRNPRTWTITSVFHDPHYLEAGIQCKHSNMGGEHLTLQPKHSPSELFNKGSCIFCCIKKWGWTDLQVELLHRKFILRDAVDVSYAYGITNQNICSLSLFIVANSRYFHTGAFLGPRKGRFWQTFNKRIVEKRNTSEWRIWCTNFHHIFVDFPWAGKSDLSSLFLRGNSNFPPRMVPG